MDWRCHNGVNDISPFLLFEAIGDSEDIDADLATVGNEYHRDDDAGSCSSETCDVIFVDDDSRNVNNYFQDRHGDVDVTDENGFVYKNTTSLSSLSSSSVYLDGDNHQESKMVYKNGSSTSAVKDDDEDIEDENMKVMNEMEKNKLFWDSCLGY
ncbi:uncharacterized protein LOC113345468 [Papaver somniferum]|uniref:uncharacterized protein LOC113345468 n=1 Tax=Papaver somniferum TaxID=3469 RepID=UPI000E6FE368|nr:uncharacterized protein LOC113345468 [Papaver somniferum]